MSGAEASERAVLGARQRVPRTRLARSLREPQVPGPVSRPHTTGAPQPAPETERGTGNAPCGSGDRRGAEAGRRARNKASPSRLRREDPGTGSAARSGEAPSDSPLTSPRLWGERRRGRAEGAPTGRLSPRAGGERPLKSGWSPSAPLPAAARLSGERTDPLSVVVVVAADPSLPRTHLAPRAAPSRTAAARPLQPPPTAFAG